jgi:hypothetical protein
MLLPLFQQGYIWFYVFALVVLMSNWLCVSIPIVLGPIKCGYASIVLAWVQLIALAQIECTLFVWIRVCGVVA